MQPTPLHGARETSLIDIEQKSLEILQRFECNIQNIYQCSDLLHVQSAVIQHLKEAANYISRCSLSISTQHPQLDLPLFEFDSLIEALESDHSIKALQQPIHHIELELRDLSVAIDQWVFILRDCPEVEHKPLVRLLAKAMCEIFEIQHFYIYPDRKDLIPDYLQKSTFHPPYNSPLK